MKRIIFSIALLFAVMATNAQTVAWFPMNISVSSGSFTETITSTRYIFDSDLLYLDFRLDTDGHTMHYLSTVKNIPYNPGDMRAEYQSSILIDYAPGDYLADKRVLWNYPAYDSEWESESFPTSSTYSFSGSCDISSTDALMFVQGIMIWNDSHSYFQTAGGGLSAQIIR